MAPDSTVINDVLKETPDSSLPPAPPRPPSFMTYASSESGEMVIPIMHELPKWPKNCSKPPTNRYSRSFMSMPTRCPFPPSFFDNDSDDVDNVQYLPDEHTISSAQGCVLRAESGKETTLKQVVNNSPRTVIIFIRWFWCALCQQYIEELSESLKDGSAARLRLDELGTSVVIIGQGDWKMIAAYRSEFSFLGQLFFRAL